MSVTDLSRRPIRVPGLQHWQPRADGGRALVLGGGGPVGVAWMGGLVVGLADLGVDLRTADTMIGTSAGAVVAANLRADKPIEDGFRRLIDGEVPLPPVRFRPVDGLRFVVASVMPGQRRYGRALLGRAALKAGYSIAENDWVDVVGFDLVGQAWPTERLVLTAVDALTGQSVAFDNESGVPLERAMAASCAVPGIYPAVEINGRRYVDGGVRTTTNVDLARGHDQVLVIAPIPYAIRRTDRPTDLLAALGDIRGTVIAPDGPSRRAMGRDFLDMARAGQAAEAGQAQAARIVDQVTEVWR